MGKTDGKRLIHWLLTRSIIAFSFGTAAAIDRDDGHWFKLEYFQSSQILSFFFQWQEIVKS